MKYYRCKCGEETGWGSMPFPRCHGCPICNTTLEQHPDFHKTPEPHEWQTKYDENTGIPYEICRWCYDRKEVPELKSRYQILKGV